MDARTEVDSHQSTMRSLRSELHNSSAAVMAATALAGGASMTTSSTQRWLSTRDNRCRA